MKANLGTKELDLREEFNNLFKGDEINGPKFHPVIIRRIRREEDNSQILCDECWNPESQEGRIDCKKCEGIGRLWDELLVPGYIYRSSYMRTSNSLEFKQKVGRASKNAYEMVTGLETLPQEGDYAYEVLSDESGGIKFPPVRTKKFYVTTSSRMRIDHNKLDYNLSVLSEI